MQKLLAPAFKLVVGALAAVSMLPWSIEQMMATVHKLSGEPTHGFMVLAGVVVSLLLVILRKPNWLIHTLIHEAAHAIVCLILFVRIHNFQASDGKGGVVVHDKCDPFRGTLIALAPYTLPLILLPLLVFRILIEAPPLQSMLDFFIAFAYIHHLNGLYHNIRLNFFGKQADLTKAGKLLSIVCISSFLCFVTALTLTVLYLPEGKAPAEALLGPMDGFRIFSRLLGIIE